MSSNTKVLAVVVVAIVAIAAVGVYVLMSGNDSEDSYSEGAIVIETPVDYNGNTALQTYTEVPERVVAGCNTALNLLLYLGLGDRIVGIYYMEEEVWSEVADEYQKVVSRIGSEKILRGNISQAVLTDWEPDCVIGWVAFHDKGIGSPSYWNNLGCNVWALHTMVDDSTFEGMKTDYDNIGKVFNVKNKTDAFITEFTEKMDTLKGILKNSKETVAIFDGAYMGDGKYWFYGTSTFIGYMLDYMGANVAFKSGGSSIDAAVVYDNAESITTMFFVCYGSVTFEKTMAFWEANETLSKTPAITNDKVDAIKLSVAYGADPSLTDVLDFLVEKLS